MSANCCQLRDLGTQTVLGEWLIEQPAQQDGRTAVGQKRRAATRARIVAAAFAIFGDENGLFARIEDVVEQAGVTRATFYNHFAGMEELREAVTREVTHDFLKAVTDAVEKIEDSREQCTVAVRFYLHRAQTDRRWALSMLNMSATGQIFGAETFAQALRTITTGVENGSLPIPSPDLGRDILLGVTLAAMGSIAKRDMAADYPEVVAGYILCGLGVERSEAKKIAHLPLPPLAIDTPLGTPDQS